jgi:hypothetical protein
MAKADDAQSALVALARHADLILDAHLNNANRIRETRENQSILESLERHRLVWRYRDDDDDSGPNLNKELVHLLAHITRAQRRRWASERIHELWSDLQELFEDYREAKRLAAYTDKDRLESSIAEHVNMLIEDIRSANEAYSSYLDGGYMYVTDLDLRIRENEKAIDRAGKLNALFDSFNINELAEQAGTDTFLRRLLLKHLPATLEEGRKNLASSISRLSVMLVRMREDQRLSRMVGGFEQQFVNNPGYVPSIADINLDNCPARINLTSEFRVASHPDVYEAADESDMVALAEVARTERDVKISDPLEAYRAEGIITNDLLSADEVDEDDPTDSLAEELILHVIDGGLGDKEIRALSVLASSGLLIDEEGWLYALEGTINALHPDDRRCLHLSYCYHPHTTYRDNIHIHDMILRQHDVSV